MLIELNDRHVPHLVEMADNMRNEGVFKDYPLHHERTEYILRELVNDPSVYTRGVVNQDKSLVGAMLGEVSTDMWVEVDVARDIALYIDPEYRNGGMGVKLLLDFTKWANRRCDRMVISVFAGIDNEKMACILGRMGYRDAGSLHIMEAAA